MNKDNLVDYLIWPSTQEASFCDTVRRAFVKTLGIFLQAKYRNWQ
jgi:hypothetical protein